MNPGLSHFPFTPRVGMPGATRAVGSGKLKDSNLTNEERQAIDGGRWFSSLSPTIRHDILRHAYVKRYADSDLIAERGLEAKEWMACAKGSVRISSCSARGKQVTLSYLDPGSWFGDVSLLDGGRRTHDAHAHGGTTILCVSRADFESVMAMHPSLCEALLRLHARRTRQLYELLEDVNTLSLRARLAKLLLKLARRHGVESEADDFETTIGFQLPQVELARLLGASRQRINQELKAMERESVVRVDRSGLVVRDTHRLLLIVDSSPGS